MSFPLSGLSLSSKFILFLTAIILMIAIPNFSQISEFFGFETKNTLKKQINDLNKEKEILESNNQNLEKALQLEKQKAIDLEKVKEESELKQKDIAQTVIRYREKIVFKTSKPGSTERAKEQSAYEKPSNELSIENITTLWKAYCELNSIQACPV